MSEKKRESNIEFTVIIPCYKNFDLLEKCVASIPDVQNIEVLIVDDASPQEDFEEFKRKISERKNIRIFRNDENHGAGYCRNFALKQVSENTSAKKHWIVFSDSDDFFTENAFTTFERYKHSSAEIIYFDVEFRDYRQTKDLYYEIYSTRRNNAINKFLAKGKSKYLRVRAWEPWAKMFSKDFIKKNDLTFHEIECMNDAFFGVNAGLSPKTIEASKEKVYVYNIFDNSGCRSSTLERDLTRLNEYCLLNKLYFSHKGYAFYLHDVLQIGFAILRKYGFKNTKAVFAVFQKNGWLSVAIGFYCVHFVYRLLTFIPRRIARKIHRRLSSSFVRQP